MNGLVFCLLCWLCIWAAGRFFNSRDRRRKLRDERSGLYKGDKL